MGSDLDRHITTELRIARDRPRLSSRVVLLLVTRFDFALESPCTRKKHDSPAAGQHRAERGRRRQAAGGTAEAPGSTGDPIGLGEVSHHRGKIDAKPSFQDHDRQETPVLEAEDAAAGYDRNIQPGARAGRLRGQGVRS
jgi:hypothetical protein